MRDMEKWYEKICLSSFCTRGRAIVREPFLIQPQGAIVQGDLHVSVLTLFRQALVGFAGGTIKRRPTGPPSFGQDYPLSTNLLEHRGDVNGQFHVLGQRGHKWPAPGTNIRPLMVCFGYILS